MFPDLSGPNQVKQSSSSARNSMHCCHFHSIPGHRPFISAVPPYPVNRVRWKGMQRERKRDDEPDYAEGCTINRDIPKERLLTSHQSCYQIAF